MSRDPNPGKQPAHRHEETDISIRQVVMWAVVLAGVVIGSMIAMWILLTMFFSISGQPAEPRRSMRPDADQRPPSPRLQSLPAQDLAAYRASQNKILNEYAWIDKTNGVVQIPIAQAMKITAASNLPVRTAPKKIAAPAPATAAAPEEPKS